MQVAEATVSTDRAERYVDQLASHLGQRAVGAETRDPAGWDLRVDIAGGTVSMSARPEGILVRVEGPDRGTLERLQEGVAGRVATIGRRDGLTVAWHGVA